LYVIGLGQSEDLGEPKSALVDLRIMDGGQGESQEVAERGGGFIVKERAEVDSEKSRGGARRRSRLRRQSTMNSWTASVRCCGRSQFRTTLASRQYAT
jgi:hypothetical protein